MTLFFTWNEKLSPRLLTSAQFQGGTRKGAQKVIVEWGEGGERAIFPSYEIYSRRQEEGGGGGKPP